MVRLPLEYLAGLGKIPRMRLPLTNAWNQLKCELLAQWRKAEGIETDFACAIGVG